MNMYQKPLSGQEYALHRNINEMLDIAEELLTATGRQILVGACNLHYLSSVTNERERPPFDDLFFVGVASECDDLPIFDDFRICCSAEHLQSCELRINDYADQVQQTVRQKCREILAKYERTDLDLLECELNDKS
ncbi:MAG: hypothetical protein Q8T09_19775 [Candidatus Melainabacteria bacterium]|nr:hypothetical protein [Candidatus Melainabacteria bacterium]